MHEKPRPRQGRLHGAHTAQNRAGAQRPNEGPPGRDAPPGGPPAPRSADVAHAPPSAEPPGRGKTPSSDRPAGQCPKTRRGPQGTTPPAVPARPTMPGGGPYAPQRRSARTRSHDLRKTRRGPQGGPPPRASPGACGARGARGARGAHGAYRKAPSASATPCPPAASRCSTLGEGGLNCRVRDGTG